MKTHKKPTARQAHWLSHLERARILKLPLAQYCRARGLNVQSLYNTRHEQSGRPRGANGNAAPRKAAGKGDRFIAVELTEAAPMRAAGPACRIELRDVVVECADLPEARWLLALSKGSRTRTS